MVKIRVLTTLRNVKHLNGLARAGDTFSVPEKYARELVENRGYAEYVEEVDEVVEIKGVEYPQGFLDMEMPDDFPNERIANALDKSGFDKFGEIIRFEDPTEIKGIGEDFAKELSEAIIEARNEYQESN